MRQSVVPGTSANVSGAEAQGEAVADLAASDAVLAETILAAHDQIDKAVETIASVLRGNLEVIRMVLAAVLSRGHVLLEDVPGVGKTTLARTVARVLGCSFSRIQFTADMLPGDVLGVQVLDTGEGTFHFRKGPIFADVVLADEINRASPKTQSAMLEAMGEGRVTVDDQSYPLPPVFTVLATQNPTEHHGAYPLPESQLDRFMLRVSLGYPPAEVERALVLEPERPALNLKSLEPVLGMRQLRALQRLVGQVQLSEPVADYLLSFVDATRRHPDIIVGASPRCSLSFSSAVRAWAYMQGRDYVLPDDVQHLAGSVLAHRLIVGGAGQANRQDTLAIIADISERLPVPR